MPSKERTHRTGSKASPKKQPAKPTRVDKAEPVVQQAGLDSRAVTTSNALGLQRMIGNQAAGHFLGGMAQQNPPVQNKAAKTGLPNSLKAGIENLSGLSMDDVQVHYNSDQPGALHALAFTEGATIHVAPGQEQHLPHEAWHVVQQKQGKVAPSIQGKGSDINVDPNLETEADVMGAKASQLFAAERVPASSPTNLGVQPSAQLTQAAPHTQPGIPVRQFLFEDNLDEDVIAVAAWLGIEPPLTLRSMGWDAFKALCKQARPMPNVELHWSFRRLVETVPEYMDILGLMQARNTTAEEEETKLAAYRDLVPSSLIEGLSGMSDLKKVDTIFERFHRIPFSYTGQRNTAMAGFLSQSGDCCTLANMFQMAVEVAGVEDEVTVHGNEGLRLVDARPVHGRPDSSNEDNGKYWVFDDHYWAEYLGLKYDLLFMTQEDYPTYKEEESGKFSYGPGPLDKCPYTIFEGGRYYINPKNASEKLGKSSKKDNLGIVFDDYSSMEAYASPRETLLGSYL